MTPVDLEGLDMAGTAHLSDACRSIGARVAVAGQRLRPIVPFSRLAGAAVTVRISLTPEALEYAPQAVRVFEAGLAVPRAVLAIRNEVPGFDSLGSFDARLALASGYVGCVTEGHVRDSEELARLLPVFATGIRPDCIRLVDLPPGHSIRVDVNVPIEVDGMPVQPGDVVVGDNDGVIAFDPDAARAVIEAAAAIRAHEAERIARLERGESVRSILGLPPD